MYVCTYVCMYVCMWHLCHGGVGPLRKTGSAGEIVSRPIPRLGTGRDPCPVVSPATGMVRASRAASPRPPLGVTLAGSLVSRLGVGGTEVPRPARAWGWRPKWVRCHLAESLGVALRGDPSAGCRASCGPWWARSASSGPFGALALGPWVGGPLGPPAPGASAVLGERPGVEQAPWACDLR